jgi:predicted O-methyltransferase YrrM
LTCIDTFLGSPEHDVRPAWAAALPEVEQRFDFNLAEFGDRVEKIRSVSSRGLARLSLAGRRFDVVYIDGSHHSEDVQADAVLSWPMVRKGGIVIFDDYEWNFFTDDPSHPKIGVDAFLTAHAGTYRELHRGYQIILEKTVPAQELQLLRRDISRAQSLWRATLKVLGLSERR